MTEDVGKRGPAALLLLVSATVFVPACEDDTTPTFLQDIDLDPPKGNAKFNRNEILSTAEFTDIEADVLSAQSVQKFLARTPYNRPSFLETYQSNGIRAADAIVSAARLYRINPLVFLVFAQITQGLLGERNYPFPPERIEYVFQCGCFQADNCRPDRAGFDRQLDCLGHQLRTSLDAIKGADRKTLSGWGPDTTSTTLDGFKVTPANDGTAALYDRLPRINEEEPGGTYVFWTVWNLYASKLQYNGPVGGVDGRWIGEPCAVASQCGIENALCATNFPDGVCTVECTGECPSAQNRPLAFCAKFSEKGFCFPQCNPQSPASCREGYTCVRVKLFGAADTDAGQFLCKPAAAQ
jgi:hypothetical protein